MTPHSKLPEESELFTLQCHQWEPIRNSQVIRKYKEISVQWQIYRYIEKNAHIDTTGRWTPHTQSNCHNSFTWYTAIQLYILSSFILSFGVQQLERWVIHFLIQKISVNFQVLLLCFWLHIVVVVNYTATTSTTTILIYNDFWVQIMRSLQSKSYIY